MNLKSLKDNELLAQIKTFVQSERDLIIKILHHLREIDRRRLYADLGCSSLFEYCVKELQYSEGQAHRRVQAMRLIKDLPEVEAKIASGELNLSNVQQAQSFFREMQSAEPARKIEREQKLEVLSKLENKSVRDAQKELVKLNPSVAMPKERERVITESTSEVRFLMDDRLKAKLEGIRSLLGPKGASMSYSELFDAMSDLSLAALSAKQFGKKRSEGKVVAPKNETIVSTSKVTSTQNPRYIPKALKHQVWQRDRGCCRSCGSRRNLNYDHVIPVAKQGATTFENLRLLCFSCNQRAGVKEFGVDAMLSFEATS